MPHLGKDTGRSEACIGHRLVSHGPELVRVVVQQLQALALEPAMHQRHTETQDSILFDKSRQPDSLALHLEWTCPIQMAKCAYARTKVLGREHAASLGGFVWAMMSLWEVSAPCLGHIVTADFHDPDSKRTRILRDAGHPQVPSTKVPQALLRDDEALQEQVCTPKDLQKGVFLVGRIVSGAQRVKITCAHCRHGTRPKRKSTFAASLLKGRNSALASQHVKECRGLYGAMPSLKLEH